MSVVPRGRVVRIPWKMTPGRSARAAVGEDALPEEIEAAADRAAPLGALALAVPWRSDAFRRALARARRFAPSPHPVVIRGESGAGKSAVAEILHRLGRDADQPLVVVNCAALPESLLQSELFGHVRGAFTGAEAPREGLLREAGAGTVFLDEIDKASASLQAALLHVLDRREVRSLGDGRTRPLHGRFVFATNADLARREAEGRFLPDLGYRIGAMAVRVPPVRERLEDLDLLIALALRELRLEERLAGVRVSAAARDVLAAHEWPGNVRELFGVVRAAARLLEGGPTIGVREIRTAMEDARAGSSGPRSAGATLAERLREVEREEILRALRVEGGNQTRAARRLGVSRRGLNKKMHRLGLWSPRGAAGRPD